MEVLIKESIDRVLNLSINHLIEYIYNGVENNELIDSYNLLLEYIDCNLIDDDDLIKFNRLKEIIFIITGQETYHEYDNKEYSTYKEFDLQNKINILCNKF